MSHSLLAEPRPEDCKGLVQVKDSPNGYSRFACIKCNYQSGDDYRQCYGRCPVEQSPHFDPDCLTECLAKRAAESEAPSNPTPAAPPSHIDPVEEESSWWDSCCDNEKRDIEGWCINCGDPCL